MNNKIIRTVRKSDLTDKIAENIGMKKTTSKAELEAVLNVITDTMRKGNAVQLIGFCTFKVSTRFSLMWRNKKQEKNTNPKN